MPIWGDMSTSTAKNLISGIRAVADLLTDFYEPAEYGRVILPFTVMRRLDCVLEPTKHKVSEAASRLPDSLKNRGRLLEDVAGKSYYNTSNHSFTSLLLDTHNMAINLRTYIAGFSPTARDILTNFNVDVQIRRLAANNFLSQVMSEFGELDLSPDVVSNREMGFVYERLVQHFSELSNETVGEYFTPREVVRLMVDLLFMEDVDLLSSQGLASRLLDPACGTGGLLRMSQEYIRNLNPQGRFDVYGQELDPGTLAMSRAYMLLTDQNTSQIRLGNSFDNDQHPEQRFDYLLSTPPFGVGWSEVAEAVKVEHVRQGFAGRFGAGLPPLHDSSFLFLQHMISKMKPPEEGGARLVILFIRSPLFTGSAGSGPSEIRRWIIENDWLEAVIALPDQLFYNTGISTYLWVVTNRKNRHRRGKVQLIDARGLWTEMPRSIGNKRKQISEEQRAAITHLYEAFEEGPRCSILPNEELGFIRITVDRPLQLRWEITHDTLNALAADRTLAETSTLQRDQLVNQMANHRGSAFSTEAEAAAFVKGIVATVFGGTPPNVIAIVITALAVRDPNAAVVTDRNGNALPDPNISAIEDISLPTKSATFEADTRPRLQTTHYKNAITQFLMTEVYPYIPDAWHNANRTQIGYEIRPRFPYVAPRPPGTALQGWATVAQHQVSPIGDLICPDGESQYLEYKSTLRWDIKEKRKCREAVPTAAIKTIAGFANSFYGGTLLIGVNDQGAVHGLEDDYATFSKRGQRGDRDLWGQHLENLIQSRLGNPTLRLVTWICYEVDGKDVARISIEPSSCPVFDGKNKNRVFWSRTPSGTRAVRDVKELNQIVFDRWGHWMDER